MQIIFIVAMLIILAVSICAAVDTSCCSLLKYFALSFGEWLNIVVVTSVVYFFVEYKNDKRIRIKFAVMVIDKIILKLEDQRLYKINDIEDRAFVTLSYRSLDNYLGLLSEHKYELAVDREVDYCIKELESYWDFVSNHFDDFDYLIKSENDLLKHVENIKYKLNKIMSELYK